MEQIKLYNSRLSHAIEIYLDEQKYDSIRDYMIFNSGTDTRSSIHWNIQGIDKPTVAQLTALINDVGKINNKKRGEDVKEEAKRFIAPIVSSVERDNLQASEGMIVINSDVNQMQFYVGGVWN